MFVWRLCFDAICFPVYDLNRQCSESIITLSAVRGIISIGNAELFT